MKKIDDWRRHQPGLPNISEAIRRLMHGNEITIGHSKNMRPVSSVETVTNCPKV